MQRVAGSPSVCSTCTRYLWLVKHRWPLYSPGMSCQTHSGGAQLSTLVMPAANGTVLHVCLYVEHFGTQKPNRDLQRANKGISHMFQVVWGCWLMPQLSGHIQEPKLRVSTFTWQLLHLQSKLNILLQAWWVFFVGFLFRRDESVSKDCLFSPSLSTVQYIARISVSFCSHATWSEGK